MRSSNHLHKFVLKCKLLQMNGATKNKLGRLTFVRHVFNFPCTFHVIGPLPWCQLSFLTPIAGQSGWEKLICHSFCSKMFRSVRKLAEIERFRRDQEDFRQWVLAIDAQAAQAYNTKLAKWRQLQDFVLGIYPCFKYPRILLLLAWGNKVYLPSVHCVLVYLCVVCILGAIWCHLERELFFNSNNNKTLFSP